MKKLIFLFLSFLLLLPVSARALHSDTYLMDTPTAEVLPLKTLGITARMFNSGGMLTYFDFSILNRFSIGASFTLEHLIGTNDEDIKVLIPALQLKFRIYDGTNNFPAIAIGFDNQGFKYNHYDNKYEQIARGLYMAFTKELFFPGFILNSGINMTVNGFEFDTFAGFVSAGYTIFDIFQFMFEWDNIRTLKESRLNSGVKIYLADFFNLDFAIRDFNHKAERVAQLKYTFAF
ncbi:MAG: hypothetical protein LBM71_01395 [Elusimicrobiota bacterium]|jgi:hypothetical protein|nr:hypothetical protein [Elusimicrobiota bacterium]